jgi:fibronectin type 3 domain-containing protein
VVNCPVQPTGLKATKDATFCQISLDWSDNPGQKPSYNVYRAPASAGPYEKIATATESQYVDQGGAAGLTAATPYYYKVSAQLADCESLLTTQRNATTVATCTNPPSPPLPPTNLTAAGGSKQISLSWTAPAGGSTPTGYRVLRSDAPGGPYTKVADVPAAPTSYTNGGLPDDTTYCYVVQSTITTLVSANSNEDCDKTSGGGGGEQFRRGDADGNGLVELTDPIFVLNNQFLGGPSPKCMDAADADNSGAYDLTDAIFSLNFQFLGGTTPPPPGPGPACGPDTAEPPDSFPACVYNCQ